MDSLLVSTSYRRSLTGSTTTLGLELPVSGCLHLPVQFIQCELQDQCQSRDSHITFLSVY